MLNPPAHRRRLLAAATLSIAAAAAGAPAVYGANYTWNGLQSGVWNANFFGITNWSPFGAVPGAADTVLFNAATPNNTINLNGDRTVSTATVSGASADFTFQNGKLTTTGDVRITSSAQVQLDGNLLWAQGNLIIDSAGQLQGGFFAATISVGDRAGDFSVLGALVVSDDDSGGFSGGLLNIFGGGKLSGIERAWLGFQEGEYGYALVSGAGSILDVNSEFYIGVQGTGSLQITDGGQVFSRQSVFLGFGGGRGSVTVSGTNSALTMGEGLDLFNGTLTINSGGSLRIGDRAEAGAAPGYLTITDRKTSLGGGYLRVFGGSTVTHGSHAVLGDQSDERGSAYVAHTGSRWTNAGDITVGNFGSGEMLIVGGGQISSDNVFLARVVSGATGSVTVAGSGSTWTNALDFYVGDHGSGTLAIEAGGTLNNGRNGYIGGSVGAEGSAVVTGAGSVWTNAGDLYVGNNGSGVLEISSGGSAHVGDRAQAGATAGYLTISDSNSGGTNGGHLHIRNGGRLDQHSEAVLGDQAGEFGYATVTGAGSLWTNAGEISVGYEGLGRLRIEAGGQVVSPADGNIGKVLGGNGMVTVTGAGSALDIEGDLHVGGSRDGSGGLGRLEALDSGLVNVTDDIRIRTGSDVTLDGGQIEARGILYNAGGDFHFISGALRVRGINSTLTQQGGTLSPRTSPDSLSIASDYNLEGGVLEIELGGLAPGTQHDRVTVGGDVAISPGATLNLSLISGFTPAAGNEFVVLLSSSGSRTGTFSAVQVPPTPALRWGINYLPNAVRVVATLPGDFDLDFDVDGQDVLIWQRNPAVGSLVDWKTHFGMSAQATPVSATVPEPATALLLIIAAAVGAIRSPAQVPMILAILRRRTSHLLLEHLGRRR